jgi:hypothetical protein
MEVLEPFGAVETAELDSTADSVLMVNDQSVRDLATIAWAIERSKGIFANPIGVGRRGALSRDVHRGDAQIVLQLQGLPEPTADAAYQCHGLTGGPGNPHPGWAGDQVSALELPSDRMPGRLPHTGQPIDKWSLELEQRDR